MTTLDLDALERAARAATPGPWFASGVRGKMAGSVWHHVNRYDEAKKQDENIACVGYDPRTGLGLADAVFIALANPTAILSLISDYRALQERVEGAEKALRPFASYVAANLTHFPDRGERLSHATLDDMPLADWFHEARAYFAARTKAGEPHEQE